MAGQSNFKTRQSYTMETKRKIAEYAEVHGNRKAGREFSVDESMVRRWKRDKAMMEKLPAKKLSMRGGKPYWPELEKDLKEFVLSEASSGSALSILIIGKHAGEMAKDRGIDNFIGGPTWCHRFMRRNRMSVDGKGGLHLHPIPQEISICRCSQPDTPVSQRIPKKEGSRCALMSGNDSSQ